MAYSRLFLPVIIVIGCVAMVQKQCMWFKVDNELSRSLWAECNTSVTPVECKRLPLSQQNIQTLVCIAATSLFILVQIAMTLCRFDKISLCFASLACISFIATIMMFLNGLTYVVSYGAYTLLATVFISAVNVSLACVTTSSIKQTYFTASGSSFFET